MLGIAETARGIAAREVGCGEVLEAHLQRIDRINPQLNALVELRPHAALADDLAAVERRATSGRSGRLGGVVVSVKDHFDLEGTRRTEGVAAHRDRVSSSDCAAVRRLKEAGAIVVGKANQPDFQIRWNTVSSLHGATRNPRDGARSAGGSSGGDAAAVAAGLVQGGLGSDYGGSIRVPASFCGVFGLRPSAGRVPEAPSTTPRQGPPTLDIMNSVGPIARSIEDLRVLYDVLTGPDPEDPATVPAGHFGPLPARGRVARVSRQTGAVIASEIERELDRVCGWLEDAGYMIEDEAFPGAPRAPELWAELLGTELIRSALPSWDGVIGESNRDHIEKLFGPFDRGPRVERYIAAFVERGELARSTAQWMERFPMVVAPIAGMTAPRLEFDEYLSAEDTSHLFDRMRNVVWVNLFGLPSIALPNGIQIVARRFREDEAFSAATIVAERLTGDAETEAEVRVLP